MYEQMDKPKENKSRAVANSVAQKKSNVKQGFGFVDNRPESIKQRKLLGNLVIQRGKVAPGNGSDSDVEIESDLENSTTAEDNALAKSFKSGKAPKKRSKQVIRVLKLRKELKRNAKRSGKKFVISSRDLQSILANLNLEYSPQNTTAIGVGGSGNMVVTKMGGVNANYLGRILKAQVLVEKRKSATGSNRYHAEKALSEKRGPKKFRRMIIDKKRCSVCGVDKKITDSADVIRD